jgi:hypothetical protein
VSSVTLISFSLLCTSISLSFWVPVYFLFSYAINHINQFLLHWKKNEERKQPPWLPLTFEKRMKKWNNSRDWRGRVFLDPSLFYPSLLTIYEWRGYHWQNYTSILSLVHLITWSFFHCCSFPWWVMNHTNKFYFTLHQNLFPFEFLSISSINLSFLGKRMNKGNNRRMVTARHSVW